MKPTKGLWIHLGLFGVATALAVATAARREGPAKGRVAEAELWGGTPDTIESISFSSEERDIKVLPKKDAVGRYGIVEIVKKPGASDQSASTALVSSQADVTKRFISVDAVESLLPALAPAKSYRSLGKIAPKQLADYGLEKPDSRLEVRIAGRSYQLDIGAPTPGSGDYYVRDPKSGAVNTLAAESLNRLKYGESRLIEHDLHGFKVDEIREITVAGGGKSRSFQRMEGKELWADAAAPGKPDETAGNWLLKVQRLKPANYVENPGDLGSVLVRVDYRDAETQLGYLELYRSTGADQKYYARTERSRWTVELPKSIVEPVDRDLGSILK